MRHRLSRYTSLVGREAVYQLEDGLEVESNQYYDVTRRRVFFDDVLLVTYHRESSPLYLVITAVFGLLFLAIAVAIVAAETRLWPMALPFLLIGLPVLVAFVLRLIFGLDIITVFGRRSKAVLRFGMRKRRAREVYGQICAAVRRIQGSVAAPVTPPSPESEAPPLPPDVPPPPP